MLRCVMITLAGMVYTSTAFFAAGKCAQALLRPRPTAALVSLAHSQLRLMASASRPPNNNREALTGERAGWRKRKVALVVGYVGTGYYGLQFNANTPHLPTIEGEIENALFKYV